MASVTIPRWLRITLIVIGLAVLTVIVGGWLFLRSLSPLSRCDERRFTPARWNDSTLAFGPAAIRGCVVDDLLRHPDDAPSIGLILCKERKALTVEYALRNVETPIGVSGYRVTEALPEALRGSLPSVEELESGLRDATLPEDGDRPEATD